MNNAKCFIDEKKRVPIAGIWTIRNYSIAKIS